MILKTILTTIIVIVVCYLVGMILSSFFKNEYTDNFHKTFVNLIIGFLTITTCYAISRTHANTVLIGYIIIAILYIAYNKRKLKKIAIHISIKTIKPLFFTIGTACVFFIFYSYFYYSEPVNNIFHFDYYFYSFNSYNNDCNGIEVAGPYQEGDSRAIPYHYLECWFVAMIANIFSINYLETYSLCLISILSSIVATGIITLSKCYKASRVMYLFAFCTIFLSAVLISYSPIRQNMAMGENIKTLIAAIFLLAFIIETQRFSNNAYLWLLCLPIANAALAPIILLSTSLYIFISWYKREKRRLLLTAISYIGCISIFLLAFYYCNASFATNKEIAIETTAPSLIRQLLHSYTLPMFLHLLYRTAINYFMYIPYFIPILLFLIHNGHGSLSQCIQEHKKLLLFFTIAVCCGFLCHFAYYPLDNYDSVQLDINITMIFMNIWSLLSFLYVRKNILLKTEKILLYIFLTIVALYNVTVFTGSIKSRLTIGNDMRDLSYRESAIQYIRDNNISHIGARFLSNEAQKRGISFKKTNDVYAMGFLGGDINGLFAYNISPMNLSEQEKHWNSISPQRNTFNDFIQLSRYKTIEEAQIAFIEKYHVSYLICTKDTDIPYQIQSKIDTSFVDTKTGERFIFLKQSNQ